MNKVRTIFAFIISLLVVVVIGQFYANKTLDEFLYSHQTQIRVKYKSGMDFQALINDVNALREKGSFVREYVYVGDNKLNIYTNVKNDAQKKIVSYYDIAFFTFDNVKNVGLNDRLYVSGDVLQAKNILSNYAEIEEVPIEKMTIRTDPLKLMLAKFCLSLLFILVIIWAIQQRKQINIQKLYGYSFFTCLKEALHFLRYFIYSWVIGSLCGSWLLFFLKIKLDLLGSIIVFSVSMVILLLFLLVYSLILSVIYCSISYASFKKNQQLTLLYGLTIVLFTLFLVTSFKKIDEITKLLPEMIDHYKMANTWKRAATIYHPISTGGYSQMAEEELSEKIKKFYLEGSKNEDFFIIDASRFGVVNRENGRPLYAGEDASRQDSRDFVPSENNSILVDVNYLKRNPIQIKDKKFFTYDFNAETIYLLVAEKYKGLEKEILQNYSPPDKDDLEGTVGLESGAQTYGSFGIRKRFSVKIIYTENDQNYFSYNASYGDPQVGNKITDPIAVVFNPNMMDPNTYLNALAGGGSLYFEAKKKDSTEAYEKIKKNLANNELLGKVNYVESVYKTYGQNLRLLRDIIIGNVSAVVLLIVSDLLLIKELVEFSIRRNQRKLFLKKTLGYSLFERIINGTYIPCAITLGSVSWVSLSTISATKLLFAAWIMLFTIWCYLIIQKKVTYSEV